MKKKKKNSAMQFKIGDLDELPFEQFFHEHPFTSLHSFYLAYSHHKIGSFLQVSIKFHANL